MKTKNILALCAGTAVALSAFAADEITILGTDGSKVSFPDNTIESIEFPNTNGNQLVQVNKKDGTSYSATVASTKAVRMSEFTVDDLCGTYNGDYSYTEYITHATSPSEDDDDSFLPDAIPYDQSGSNPVTITKVNDNTVAIDGLITVSDIFGPMQWSGMPLNAVVDFEARTLTFDPQDWGMYFFASEDNMDTEVIGTINEDGSIDINDWSGWFKNTLHNQWFKYFTNAKCHLVKYKKESIDVLAGTYSQLSKGYEAFSAAAGLTSDWQLFNVTHDARIEVIDDTHIKIIGGFYYDERFGAFNYETEIIASVDMDTRTITIDYQNWDSDKEADDDFKFAYNSPEESTDIKTAQVIGRFDKDYTITFTDWMVYAESSDARLNLYTSTTLTKK